MNNIHILTGSTRSGRFNIQPARWLARLGESRRNARYNLVDIAEFNLPLLDEPKSATSQEYQNDHTKKFSEVISQADGFVFVTPEYNHSYSAALKNAVDYLYVEWSYKPVAFLSYGSMAGGSRAVEHLRVVVGELKMFDIREQVLLPNYWSGLDGEGNFQFTPQHEKAASVMFDSLVFWAGKMKQARLELPRE